MSLNQNVQLADEVEHPLEWVSMEEDFFGKTVSTPVQRMCDKLETLAQVAHAACGVPSNDLGMEESFDLMEELGLFNTFMSDTLPDLGTIDLDVVANAGDFQFRDPVQDATVSCTKFKAGTKNTDIEIVHEDLVGPDDHDPEIVHEDLVGPDDHDPEIVYEDLVGPDDFEPEIVYEDLVGPDDFDPEIVYEDLVGPDDYDPEIIYEDPRVAKNDSTPDIIFLGKTKN